MKRSYIRPGGSFPKPSSSFVSDMCVGMYCALVETQKHMSARPEGACQKATCAVAGPSAQYRR